MEILYLSRRNLLTLLSKLDRFADGEYTARMLIKCDNAHPKFPASKPEIAVIAVEDDQYYIDRFAGEIHPADKIKLKTGVK